MQRPQCWVLRPRAACGARTADSNRAERKSATTFIWFGCSRGNTVKRHLIGTRFHCKCRNGLGSGLKITLPIATSCEPAWAFLLRVNTLLDFHEGTAPFSLSISASLTSCMKPIYVAWVKRTLS